MGRMRNPIRALALLVLSLSVPVEARAAEPREVRPHPCRVPGYDQDVLCATYPVWENRAARQGRKIGLNIVILPALGPDKQSLIVRSPRRRLLDRGLLVPAGSSVVQSTKAARWSHSHIRE